MAGQAPDVPGPEVHRVDVGVAVARQAHDHVVAVGREARREGHAREVAQDLALAGVQIEEIDPRQPADIGDIGDLLIGRREARGQHQGAAVGQEPVVLAVLVHDAEPLDTPRLRPALGDVDHAGVEVAVLAGQALVDRVGDDVRDAPPVGRRREVGEAGQLLFGEDVPEPELDVQPAVRLQLDRSADQALGVDETPVGKTRCGAEAF